MSLLTLLQDVADIVQIDRPTSVVAATDPTTRQLKAFAQEIGDELARSFDWRKLKVSANIVGDGSTEFWDLPSDFDRQASGDVLWLQSAPFIPLSGPLSDQDFIAMKAAPTRPIRPIWRYFGDQMQLWPVLSDTQVCLLEYRTSHWIISEDGATLRSKWSADSDEMVVPERIVKLGMVYRWRSAKKLDCAQEFATYQLEAEKARKADAGSRTLKAAELFNRDNLTGRKNLYSIVVST